MILNPKVWEESSPQRSKWSKKSTQSWTLVPKVPHLNEFGQEAHLELFSNKWLKNDQSRQIIVTTTSDDFIKLPPFSYVDLSHLLMTRSKVIDSNLILNPKVWEELFNEKIQIRSQHNLQYRVPKESHVNEFGQEGLQMTLHLRSYPFGWLQDDVEIKID